uniref:Transthyretin-like family protein n=1 Tax=Panagrellus redivivus TaxID=6233 RepID=A0A7E4URK4_PANRE
MRLLVELLLGLVLLIPFADAGKYYKVTGEFRCQGRPKGVDVKIIEHDPVHDDIREFSVLSKLDYLAYDTDSFWYPNDPLELTIHVYFECGKCKRELYQFIDPAFQRRSQWSANKFPVVFGTADLTNVCEYGTVPTEYHGTELFVLRKQWLVRDKNINLREQ